MSTAVVVIDLQYDFIDPLSSSVGHFEKAIAIPGVQALLDSAHSRGWTVYHAITVHDGTHTMPRFLQDRVKPYCLRGSPGAAIVGRLQAPSDVVVEKQSYSALSGTNLREQLAEYKTVILAGTSIDCCVLLTAFNAMELTAANLLVPYQAVSATSEEAYAAGLAIVSKSAAQVVDLQDLLAPAVDLGHVAAADPISQIARAWVRPRLERAAQIAGGLKEQAPAQLELLVDQLVGLSDGGQYTRP